MIQVTAHMRILAAVTPVDFRKGIDGLCAVCRQELQSDPFTGTLFVFVNRRRSALRILYYDGQGFWLCHKRLSWGRSPWRLRSGVCRELAAKQLAALLWNEDPFGHQVAMEDFHPLVPTFFDSL